MSVVHALTVGQYDHHKETAHLSWDYMWYYLPVLLAVILGVIVGCSASDKENEQLRTLSRCMEQIEGDQVSSPECRRRASKICYVLSRELPLSTRIRNAIAQTKGITSDLVRIVGIKFEPWNEGDCVASYQDICHDLGLVFPCQYETCLNKIPQECAKYGDRRLRDG